MPFILAQPADQELDHTQIRLKQVKPFTYKGKYSLLGTPTTE